MKKLFIIAILLLTTVFAFSQNQRGLVYRCTETSIKYTGDEKWQSSESNFVVHMDLSKNVITFDNKTQSKYVLRYEIGEEKSEDELGNKFTLTLYKAYDEEGIGCDFTFIQYENYPQLIVMIFYTDIQIAWVLIPV